MKITDYKFVPKNMSIIYLWVHVYGYFLSSQGIFTAVQFNLEINSITLSWLPANKAKAGRSYEFFSLLNSQV